MGNLYRYKGRALKYGRGAFYSFDPKATDKRRNANKLARKARKANRG